MTLKGVLNSVQGKSDACWFLLIKTMLIKKINKKRETALKNKAGGDEKHVFFVNWPSFVTSRKP